MKKDIAILLEMIKQKFIKLSCVVKSHIGGHAVAPVEFNNEGFVELANILLPCVWKLSFSCLRLSVTEE